MDILLSFLGKEKYSSNHYYYYYDKEKSIQGEKQRKNTHKNVMKKKLESQSKPSDEKKPIQTKKKHLNKQ